MVTGNMSKLRKFKWWTGDNTKCENRTVSGDLDMNPEVKGGVSLETSRFRPLHLSGSNGVSTDSRTDVGAKLARQYDTSGSSTPVNVPVSPPGGGGSLRKEIPASPLPDHSLFVSRIPSFDGNPSSTSSSVVPKSQLTTPLATPLATPSSTRALSFHPPGTNISQRDNSSKSLLSRCAPCSPSSSVAGSVVSTTSKQRLGDLLNKIDIISIRLKSQGDLTRAKDFLPDLMFLAAQCASRNKHDAPIRRRVVAKLITSGVLDIVIKVFWYLHSVNYLDVVCEWNETETKISADKLNGMKQRYKDINCSTDNGDYKQIIQCVQAVIACLATATEKSSSLSEGCIKRGLLQELLLDLADPRMNCTDAKPHFKVLVVRSFLSILTNIARNFCGSRDAFRLVSALASLQMHSRSTLVSIRACCITLLSYITTEGENELVNSTDKNIGMVVKMLETSITSGGYSQQFGCSTADALQGNTSTLLAGLNKLAIYDLNKERIKDTGGIPLYVKAMTSSSLPPASSSLLNGFNGKVEEQLLATKGIWLLAHNLSCRNFLYSHDACINALRKLSTEGATNEIKISARGSLYTIYGNRNVGLPRSITSNSQLSMDVKYDVVVSYEWSARVQVARICDRLTAYGCSVWLNLDHRGGAPIDRTRELIEKACVVLICLSDKYKNCPSCRAECSLSKDNSIIPIRIQNHYSADGWLLDIIGDHYIYDFSCEPFVSVTFPAFIKDVTSCFPLSSSYKTSNLSSSTELKKHMSSSNSVITSPGSVISQSKSSISPSIKLEKWSPRDVSDWLLSSGLEQVKDRFKQINGILLIEILRLQDTAPETFYTILRRDLDLDFIHLLRFTAALQRLQ